MAAARVCALVAVALAAAVGRASGQALRPGSKPARTFEQLVPTRLGAEECWSKRQFEKEAYENLRLELEGCEAARAAATNSIGSGPCITAPAASPSPRPKPPPPPPPPSPGGFCSFLGCASQPVVVSAPAPAPAAPAEVEQLVARAGKDVRPPTSGAPVRDKRTGLCTWQALSTVPTGRWVPEEEARKYMGDSGSFDRYPPYNHLHRACVEKKAWYTCPNFKHTRQWLPDLVRERRCSMTYMTPPSLHNITRRPLKILLHGDSLFKGLYKAFVCQWSRYVLKEEHANFETKGYAEGWISHLAGGFELQYIYRDNAFENTAAVAQHTGFRDMDEFDVLVTNFGNISTYHRIAQERGYNGVLVHASHGCARCHKGSADRCHYGTLTSHAARRTLGYITLDLCALTLPQHNYSAMWAPAGKPMNRADPHLCSPGPDNQLMNILAHMLASYFRGSAA